VPLYQRYGAEDQLSAMYDPVVQLKSGGYLVINPTEALVSIDINSGRSTKEHGIEGTAVGTNLEAAREIARQLRLRDMAGLVVIDFIDMEYGSNVRKVEKVMKDALKNDRARIQVGRISSFGLMEMSRQRLRTGVLEASTRPCVHCEGTGLMRTASSAGLSALRIIEDEAARGRGDRICLRAGREAAIYVLNKKRAELAEIEERYGVTVEVLVDESFEGARMSVDSSGARPIVPVRAAPVAIVDDEDDDLEIVDDDEDEEIDEDERAEHDADSDGERGPREDRGPREEGDGTRRRRRRRRGGRGRTRREDGSEIEGSEGTDVEGTGFEGNDGPRDEHAADDFGDEPVDAVETDEAAPQPVDGEELPRRSRRGRRGGRGGRRERGYEDAPVAEGEVEGLLAPETEPQSETVVAQDEPVADEAAEDDAPKTRRRPRARKAAEAPVAAAPKAKARSAVVTEPVAEAPAEEAPAPAEEAPAKPKRRSRAKAAPVVEAAEAEADDAAPAPSAAASAEPSADTLVASNDMVDASDDKPRSGWWSRTFG